MHTATRKGLANSSFPKVYEWVRGSGLGLGDLRLRTPKSAKTLCFHDVLLHFGVQKGLRRCVVNFGSPAAWPG